MRERLRKLISSGFLVPLTRWYLRKERSFSTHGTTITVFPDVFHPGLFFSTRFLTDYLFQQQVSGLSLLELGCGSGLISVLMAKRGAHVTASDINPKAIENVTVNSQKNGTDIRIIHSDLMEHIPVEKFDYIIVNPPFFAGAPADDAGHAWYAGANFEYFKKLFSVLSSYAGPQTKVIMVLPHRTDKARIFGIADSAGFYFELLGVRQRWLDGGDFLYQVKR